MPNFVYQPPKHPITILYQDDSIVVADKPAGLLSVPGRLPEHKDCLLSRMAIIYDEVHCVHRLDMDTSGIMLIARNKPALSNLSKQFQQRTVEKLYHAVIWGQPESAQGEINEPLITDWPNRPRQKICYETGKASQTRYSMVSTTSKASLIELYPMTGRSHQLRVHLQSIGHPILGCRFYAHQQALDAASRLMLHASKLNFCHPVSQIPMELNSPHQFSLCGVSYIQVI